MYPMTSPRGPSRGDENINPESQFSTKAIDYLKFTVYDPESGANPYNYVSGPLGGGPGAKQIGNDTTQKNSIYKTIYLYLPHQLKEAYGVNYEKATLGAFGAAGTEVLQGKTADDIAPKLKDAADSGKTEVAFSAIAGVFNNATGALGLEGNVSKQNIAALAKGKVFNPYEETVFKGVNYRSHSFDFDMSPRNPKEAIEIQEIISCMRESMLPDTNGINARWLTIPRFFGCEIVRYTPRGFGADNAGEGLNKPASLSALLRFPTNLVLTSMNVDLTPSGQNTSLRQGFQELENGTMEDYGPASYKLSLSFDETAFVTRNMITGDDRDPTANLGTKSGDFNLGTSGKGMPSNPKGRLKVDRSNNSGLGGRVNRRGRRV